MCWPRRPKRVLSRELDRYQRHGRPDLHGQAHGRAYGHRHGNQVEDGYQALTFTGTVVWARRNAMKTMGRFAYGVTFNIPTRDHKAFVADNFIETRDQNTP